MKAQKKKKISSSFPPKWGGGNVIYDFVSVDDVFLYKKEGLRFFFRDLIKSGCCCCVCVVRSSIKEKQVSIKSGKSDERITTLLGPCPLWPTMNGGDWILRVLDTTFPDQNKKKRGRGATEIELSMYLCTVRSCNSWLRLVCFGGEGVVVRSRKKIDGCERLMRDGRTQAERERAGGTYKRGEGRRSIRYRSCTARVTSGRRGAVAKVVATPQLRTCPRLQRANPQWSCALPMITSLSLSLSCSLRRSQWSPSPSRMVRAEWWWHVIFQMTHTHTGRLPSSPKEDRKRNIFLSLRQIMWAERALIIPSLRRRRRRTERKVRK